MVRLNFSWWERGPRRGLNPSLSREKLPFCDNYVFSVVTESFGLLCLAGMCQNIFNIPILMFEITLIKLQSSRWKLPFFLFAVAIPLRRGVPARILGIIIGVSISGNIVPTNLRGIQQGTSVIKGISSIIDNRWTKSKPGENRKAEARHEEDGFVRLYSREFLRVNFARTSGINIRRFVRSPLSPSRPCWKRA